MFWKIADKRQDVIVDSMNEGVFTVDLNFRTSRPALEPNNLIARIATQRDHPHTSSLPIIVVLLRSKVVSFGCQPGPASCLERAVPSSPRRGLPAPSLHGNQQALVLASARGDSLHQRSERSMSVPKRRIGMKQAFNTITCSGL